MFGHRVRSGDLWLSRRALVIVRLFAPEAESCYTGRRAGRWGDPALLAPRETPLLRTGCRGAKMRRALLFSIIANLCLAELPVARTVGEEEPAFQSAHSEEVPNDAPRPSETWADIWTGAGF